MRMRLAIGPVNTPASAVLIIAAALFALGAGLSMNAAAQARRSPAAASGNPLDAVLQPLTQWLERANREYQETIVKGLSVPTGKGAALAPAKPAEAVAQKLVPQTAAAPTVIDQVRGWLGMDPAGPASKTGERAGSATSDPAVAEKAAKDGDLQRQLEARQLEQLRSADEQRIAANANKVRALAELATQQRQKLAEADRLAEEERRKSAAAPVAAPAVAPPVAIAPVSPARAPQVAEAGKPFPPKPDEKEAAPPQKAAGPVAEVAAQPKQPVDAPAKPTVQPAPAQAWIQAAELNQPLPEPVQSLRKAAGRLAEAANSAANRALSRSEPNRKLRLAVAAHDAPSKGRARNKCSRAGAINGNVYVVKRGDTLWDIAQRYYDNGAKFAKIAQANDARIGDPDLIFPCQKVYLPGRHAWLWLVEGTATDAS